MSITAATCNVRHGRPRRGFARLDLLVRQCATLEADVLGLQEVDRRVARSCFADQPRRIGRALDMQVGWAPARRPILVGHEGNALLVRGILRSWSVLALPHSPPRYGRNALLAHATVDDVDLSIAVTHLHNDGETATRQLPVVLEQLARMPEPRLLLGDLNLDRARVAPVLAHEGYDVADGGPTVPAEAPVRQIDFVAVRGLAVRSARVHPAILSDHRPHSARLG